MAPHEHEYGYGSPDFGEKIIIPHQNSLSLHLQSESESSGAVALFYTNNYYKHPRLAPHGDVDGTNDDDVVFSVHWAWPLFIILFVIGLSMIIYAIYKSLRQQFHPPSSLPLGRRRGRMGLRMSWMLPQRLRGDGDLGRIWSTNWQDSPGHPSAPPMPPPEAESAVMPPQSILSPFNYTLHSTEEPPPPFEPPPPYTEVVDGTNGGQQEEEEEEDRQVNSVCQFETPIFTPLLISNGTLV